MDFMTGMVLLQQELNRKARMRRSGEWSLGAAPERRAACCEGGASQGGRAVPQSDRRSGPRLLPAFVIRRLDVAAPIETLWHRALGFVSGKCSKQADERHDAASEW